MAEITCPYGTMPLEDSFGGQGMTKFECMIQSWTQDRSTLNSVHKGGILWWQQIPSRFHPNIMHDPLSEDPQFSCSKLAYRLPVTKAKTPLTQSVPWVILWGRHCINRAFNSATVLTNGSVLSISHLRTVSEHWWSPIKTAKHLWPI